MVRLTDQINALKKQVTDMQTINDESQTTIQKSTTVSRFETGACWCARAWNS
jgi:hypothetical protein